MGIFSKDDEPDDQDQAEDSSTDDSESTDSGLPDREDVSDETLKEIDQEREERLDPENRPDGSEVDNTERTFDHEAGMFTDSDDYDEVGKPFADKSEDSDEE